MAVSNIILSIVFALRFGIVGLAAGSAISYTIFVGGPYYLRLGSLMEKYSTMESER
jgi:O-antigen/teichoic acid export membrane protein